MNKAEIYRTTRLTESYWPADTSRPLCDWTLAQALREVAAEVPDRLALVEGVPDLAKRRRWTYSQLLADAERVASALLDRFKPGERVAVLAPNIVEWVLVEYGCAIAGIVLVTVNPGYKAQELEYILKQSEAVGLFAIDEYRGHNMSATAQEVCKNLPYLREIISFSDFDDFMNSGSNSVRFPEIKPYDPTIIIYTSGTTGSQKGTLLHSKGIVNASFFAAERSGMEIGGVWISPVPMFHMASCIFAVVGTLMWRGTHVLVPAFDPAIVLDLIESEGATFTLMVPTMIEAILAYPYRKKYNISTLKNIETGAAMVEASLVRRVKSELGSGVTIVFGQTETHGIISLTHQEDSDKDQSETLGQPMPHCEVKIADPETAKVLPLGVQGEICLRGYQTMLGFYNMPDKTAEVLKSDGWLHTGDLGTMDERGFLKITGRIKDMIIRGGENIYPREIEILLLEHPKVQDVAVLGVPDKYWGEQVAAFIIPESSENRPTPTELHEYCRANLTHFKTPKFWYFVSEFPRTPGYGKIKKVTLREMILKGELVAETV